MTKSEIKSKKEVVTLACIYIVSLILDKKGFHDREIKGVKNFFGRTLMPYVRSYFSSKLVKTVDLDPSKSYLFAVHPHGVICLSYHINVLENPHFYDLYKGLKTTTCTLPANFYIPIWKEMIQAIGFISSNVESILNCIRPGVALSIVVGGAKEYNYMEKGTLDLVLRDRKGFIKVAIKSGASLVPVINFGENEIYIRGESSEFMKKIFRIFRASAPSFSGRFGTIMPFQHELVTVIGSPVHTIKTTEPTQEMIDDIHQQYLQGLRDLYDAYKDQYFTYRIKDMEFV
ncbi:2-acylglycerol O-acyltransferase 2 [Globomyces sp. JEL0801]|nr:2-acylglycerol O-acyltransferase 2 [Globomyces sp. JEL0801]